MLIIVGIYKRKGMLNKRKKRAQKVLKRWKNYAERQKTAKSVWVSDTKWVGLFQYEHKCNYALRRYYE